MGFNYDYWNYFYSLNPANDSLLSMIRSEAESFRLSEILLRWDCVSCLFDSFDSFGVFKVSLVSFVWLFWGTKKLLASNSRFVSFIEEPLFVSRLKTVSSLIYLLSDELSSFTFQEVGGDFSIWMSSNWSPASMSEFVVPELSISRSYKDGRQHSRFKENLNKLPWPIPGDSTPIWPPLDSTMLFEINRPSPIPQLFCSAVRYSFPNLLKSLGKSSYAIPTPVSLKCTMRRF